MIPLLIPLFISAFRRADELAIAMEARCYRGGVNRTRMNVMTFQWIDWVASGILMGYLFIIIYCWWYGL